MNSDLSSVCQELIAIDTELKRLRSQRNTLQQRFDQLQTRVVQYIETSQHDSITTTTHVFELRKVQRHKALPKKTKHAVLEQMVREKASPQKIIDSMRKPLPVQTVVHIRPVRR